MLRLLNALSEWLNQMSDTKFLSISFMYVVIVWLMASNGSFGSFGSGGSEGSVEHMFDWVSAEGVMYLQDKFDHDTLVELHHRFK